MEKDAGVVTTTLSGSREIVREEMNGTHTEEAPKNSFTRYINPFAIRNFSFCMQCGWEVAALTFQFSWLNGGPAAIIYGAVIAGIGSSLVAAAFGEMASMDPAVGAQYRWSAKFAPRAPEFWGFLQGWITVIAWLCSMAGAFSVMSNTLSGLIILNNPTYQPKSWHATLFLITSVVICLSPNLRLRRIINYLESIGGFLHVANFIVVIITLLSLAKKSTPKFVFKTLHTGSGWNNPGTAFSIGMLTTAWSISCFDGVLHMIDETKQPRKQVPRAIFYATVLNALMQLAFCICLMFCVGDVDAITKSILPIAEVFYSATGSKAASTFLVLLIETVHIIANINGTASVSRLVWAFARDRGLPFPQLFSYIHPTLQVPLPALFLMGVVCCLLSLINLGSTVAFNALVALSMVALCISYLIPIVFLTLRQLTGKHPKYGPWRLGRWSMPVKLGAIVYLVYIAVFVPFPTSLPVTAVTMNYAAPIFLGAVLLALVDWMARGRNIFEVPNSVVEWEAEEK